jgi:hypothetical protein
MEDRKEIEEIKFTPDYEAGEPVFWRVFEELSTGKFYSGEAVLMIEHLEKIGKIEHTGDYHVYRIKKPASPNAQGGGKLKWL